MPVAAHAQMSFPISATGMVLVWMGVGVTKPRAATACDERRISDKEGERAKTGANVPHLVVHNHIDMVSAVVLYNWSSSSLLSLIPRSPNTEGLGTRLLLT